MSGTNVSEEKLSLKLMVNTKSQKVVFAEAGTSFVDFIFHLLSLPLAKVVDLLKDKGMNGCLGSVFKSFHSLESEYFDPEINKDSVFSPKIDVVVPLLSLNDKASFPSVKKCYFHDQCTLESGVNCPSCSGVMNYQITYVKATSSSNKTQRYVTAAVRYMVMDNLEVKPMTVDFLKYHSIDFDKLEEKAVQVGVKEAIEILKASLTTDAVLTTVFMEKANKYLKPIVLR